MFFEDLPIEYYGVDNNSKYNSPIVTEKIIHFPDNIHPKNILKVYSDLDVIFNTQSNTLENMYYCICNIKFNIEYIDNNKDDTISIFNDYLYCPLYFPITNNFSLNNFNPKISNLHLKLLNTSDIYVYISISPY
ncbi:hypothetical protein [Clostridium weizhouense]|uniref:Uncharacterized protein n=1 Tax=Clostridium weizhouense TaxID=2859781 RepID=A0ABS7AP51_9CLOT|nr:hypothetical protein [Clostridium weizhouense]MBW6409260.1 hypothetical protein [Clostridium weizhouense]